MTTDTFQRNAIAIDARLAESLAEIQRLEARVKVLETDLEHVFTELKKILSKHIRRLRLEAVIPTATPPEGYDGYGGYGP